MTTKKKAETASLSEAEITAIATAVATKAAAVAAAEVLATATATAAKAELRRDSGDHDEFIRLQVQVGVLNSLIASNHLAVMSAVTDVKTDVRKVDDKVAIQNGRTAKLEVRWMQSAAVIAFLVVVIPLLLATVSILTR